MGVFHYNVFMHELPKAYNPKEHEEKIYRLWERGGYFKPKPRDRNKKFVAWMAPPNITGTLHMGHALENTLIDVIVRKRRMQGYETLWIPGTDHAGIATQNAVEKELRKAGLTRWQLGREKFVERVWQWREKYGGLILEQLRKLGVSADWSRLAFTLDPGYAKAVFTAFSEYHKAGWIYRDRKVINWCPRCATTISDLEVEHKTVAGKLWFIKYPLKDDGYINVATTRPETMLGDTAVAVNPKDDRYKTLVGKTVILPIQNREIPIVSDKIVDPKFGTGAVKVTPAHDVTDYEISLRHKLPMIQVIDERGRMTKEAGPEFEGLGTGEARERVVEKLRALGFIEKIDDYQLSVATCERCGTTIEPIPSWQWFVKMSELSKLGLRPIKNGETKIIPPRWEKPYVTWLKNVRDWPISRQLWWGHRLPVYYCRKKLEELPITNYQLPKYIVAFTKPAICPICKHCEMQQSEDVLDTWFSSALWPFATLGWPEKTADLKRYYPGNIISSAPEILYLWIARMVFSGMYFMKKTPFSTDYVHATVLTKEGRRMSKSLGTGIDPIELINKYGADATRFGLIWQTTGVQAIHFDESAVSNGMKFANKIWNAARFIIMKVGTDYIKKNIKTEIKPPNKNLSRVDRQLVRDLKKMAASYERDIEAFRFGQAAQTIYHFIWHVFCDKYLEYAKKETRPELNQMLLWSIVTFLKLLHPMMPFVTESIWQHIAQDQKPLIVQEWPKT